MSNDLEGTIEGILAERNRGMPRTYIDVVREAMKSPVIMARAEEDTKRALYNLNVLIEGENRGTHDTYWLGDHGSDFRSATDLGLVEAGKLRSGTYGRHRYFSSTSKGREVHATLCEQGYEFVLPKGGTVGSGI